MATTEEIQCVYIYLHFLKFRNSRNICVVNVTYGIKRMAVISFSQRLKEKDDT